MSNLVTVYGGSGFIGRYIVQKLARSGYRVRVATRRPNEAIFLKTYGMVGQVEPILCNIRNESSIRNAMLGADAVVNCVGILESVGKNKFVEVQHKGADFVSRIASQLGVKKLVHISAIGADIDSKSIYLRLKDGVRYEGLPGNKNVNILDFDQYDLEIVSGDSQEKLAVFEEIEEKNTLDLIKDGGLLANAELQWRISQPISILILSVLGVFFGKSSPRTGKGVNLLIGIIFFMIYNNSLLIAKNSIESGQLNPIIGMFGIHGLVLTFILIFYQFRQGKFAYFIDKISFFNIKEKNHV